MGVRYRDSSGPFDMLRGTEGTMAANAKEGYTDPPLHNKTKKMAVMVMVMMMMMKKKKKMMIHWH